MQGSLEQPPIIIRGVRWHWRRLRLLLPLAAVAASVWSSGLKGQAASPTNLALIAVLVLNLALQVWSFISPTRLQISPSGITLKFTWRTRLWGWDEIGQFRMVHYVGAEYLGFDYAPGAKRRSAYREAVSRMSGADGLLVGAMEVDVETLAGLLNDASRRWLTQPAVVTASVKPKSLFAVALAHVLVLLSGRADRRLYWIAFGVVAAVVGLASLTPTGLANISPVAIIASLMIGRARLRDLGWSPQWTFLVILIVIGAWLVASVFGLGHHLPMIVSGLTFAGLLIWAGVIPGDKGPNRFGSPPGGDETRVAAVFT